MSKQSDEANQRRSYFAKLKDPRWQKRRLEILSRDEFTCQLCEDKESTLHVHHKRYLWGKEPWDIPDNALVTLCESCHELETEFLKDAVADLAAIIRDRFNTEEIDVLCSLFLHFEPKDYGTHFLGVSPLEWIKRVVPKEPQSSQ